MQLAISELWAVKEAVLFLLFCGVVWTTWIVWTIKDWSASRKATEPDESEESAVALARRVEDLRQLFDGRG